MIKAGFIFTFFLIPLFCTGQSKTFNAYQKGEIRLDLKLPYVNYLSLTPNKQFRDNKIGFLGFGIGLEYSYKENKFLETSFSKILTFELPFPAPIDRERQKAFFTDYCSITDNFIIKHFTLGYGLNYSKNYWNEWDLNLGPDGGPPTSSGYYSKYYSYPTLGVILNSYYIIDKSLNIGLIYRPSLLNLDKRKYINEHLISLEFNWKIKLINLKKNKNRTQHKL